MKTLFLQLIHCSAAATAVGIAVWLIRAPLKTRVPRWAFCCLWMAVLIRLLLPVTPVSPVSFFEVVPGFTATGQNESWVELRLDQPMEGQVPFPVLEGPESTPDPQPTVSQSYQVVWQPVDWVYLLFWVWLWGFALLLGYSALCWLYLSAKRSRGVALATYKNIPVYQSDCFQTPVVFGLLRPCILLPASFPLEESAALDFVLAHEYTHIRRRDHLLKAIATLALYLHWFNPFVWWFYRCYAADMEGACDEQVVLGLGVEKRADYAAALLELAVGPGNPFSGGILAFGESAIGERVKGILKIHRRTVLSVLLTLGVVLGLLVVFLTGPQPESSPIPVENPSSSQESSSQPQEAPESSSESQTPAQQSQGASSVSSSSSQPAPMEQGNGEGPFSVNLGQVAYGNFYPAGENLYLRLTDSQLEEWVRLLGQTQLSSKTQSPSQEGDVVELRFRDGTKWTYQLWPEYLSAQGVYYFGQGCDALWQWKEELKNSGQAPGIRWLGYMNDYRILEVSQLEGEESHLLLSATRSGQERETILQLAGLLKELTVDPAQGIYHVPRGENPFDWGGNRPQEKYAFTLTFDSQVVYTIRLYEGERISVSSSDMEETQGYLLLGSGQGDQLIAWMEKQDR